MNVAKWESFGKDVSVADRERRRSASVVNTSLQGPSAQTARLLMERVTSIFSSRSLTYTARGRPRWCEVEARNRDERLPLRLLRALGGHLYWCVIPHISSWCWLFVLLAMRNLYAPCWLSCYLGSRAKLSLLLYNKCGLVPE